MKHKSDLSQEELTFIQKYLPNTIMRRGCERELSASIYTDADTHEQQYSVWYGFLSSGNYTSENADLGQAVADMIEYINYYKDIDELTFAKLCIDKCICMHCKVELKPDNSDGSFFCQRCKSSYFPSTWFERILFKIQRWLFLKFLRSLH